MKMDNKGHPVFETAKKALASATTESARYALKQACFHLFKQEGLTQESGLETLRFHYGIFQERGRKGLESREVVNEMLQALKDLAAEIKKLGELALG